MPKGIDYYEALGLTRNADDTEIKRAYRRLALHYHPDTDPVESSQNEFVRVCEAFDVLSDPKRKGFYDLFGEAALKEGIPDGKGGVKGGFYTFDPQTTPHQVFARFFGTSNPYEALNAISAQFQAMTTLDQPVAGKKKTYDVFLELEEIYHGCLKTVTHTRKVLKEDGTVESHKRTLTIDVKPGLPEGTRFVFEGEGHQTPKTTPGLVVFVLKSKTHTRFQRRGYDLVHKVVLPLYQSLVGAPVEVAMLDGRVLTVPITDIVTPGYSLVVPSEGMPQPDGTKGKLILEIELLFPSALSEPQKMLLKSAFFLPATLTSEQCKAIRVYEAAFKDTIRGWAAAFPKDDETDQKLEG